MGDINLLMKIPFNQLHFFPKFSKTLINIKGFSFIAECRNYKIFNFVTWNVYKILLSYSTFEYITNSNNKMVKEY